VQTARRIPYGRILVFWTGAYTFSSKYLLNYTHEAEWAPFQTHYFSEYLVAPEIEPGTLDLQPGTPQLLLVTILSRALFINNGKVKMCVSKTLSMSICIQAFCIQHGRRRISAVSLFVVLVHNDLCEYGTTFLPEETDSITEQSMWGLWFTNAEAGSPWNTSYHSKLFHQWKIFIFHCPEACDRADRLNGLLV
jgi:hypothetical protein